MITFIISPPALVYVAFISLLALVYVTLLAYLREDPSTFARGYKALIGQMASAQAHIRYLAKALKQEHADRLLAEKNAAYREGLFLGQIEEREARIRLLEKSIRHLLETEGALEHCDIYPCHVCDSYRELAEAVAPAPQEGGA